MKLADLAPLVSSWFGGENFIDQAAVLKLIGEEHSTGDEWGGWKGVWDRTQDTFDGLIGFDHGFRVPENWRRGNFFQKAATEFDLLDHDIGISNINVGSAAKLGGITSPEEIGHMAKYLVTDEGTVDYAAQFIVKAQADLAPFIAGLDARTQTQIIVDYARQGPDTFWSRVMQRRNLDAKALQTWKQSPGAFVSPNGAAPASLKPNPKNFIPRQFEQIDDIMQKANRLKNTTGK